MERVLAEPSFTRAWFVGPIYHQAAEGLPGLAEAVSAARVTFAESREPVLPQLQAGLGDGDLLVLKASRGIGLDQLLEKL